MYTNRAQHDEFGYLCLVGSATPTVTDLAGGDYVCINLNPSYSLPQDGEDVKLEDN